MLNNVQMDLPLTLFNVFLVLLDVKDVSIAGNASNVLVRIKVGPFIFIMEIVYKKAVCLHLNQLPALGHVLLAMDVKLVQKFHKNAHLAHRLSF